MAEEGDAPKKRTFKKCSPKEEGLGFSDQGWVVAGLGL